MSFAIDPTAKRAEARAHLVELEQLKLTNAAIQKIIDTRSGSLQGLNDHNLREAIATLNKKITENNERITLLGNLAVECFNQVRMAARPAPSAAPMPPPPPFEAPGLDRAALPPPPAYDAGEVYVVGHDGRPMPLSVAAAGLNSPERPLSEILPRWVYTAERTLSTEHFEYFVKTCVKDPQDQARWRMWAFTQRKHITSSPGGRVTPGERCINGKTPHANRDSADPKDRAVASLYMDKDGFAQHADPRGVADCIAFKDVLEVEKPLRTEVREGHLMGFYADGTCILQQPSKYGCAPTTFAMLMIDRGAKCTYTHLLSHSGLTSHENLRAMFVFEDLDLQKVDSETLKKGVKGPLCAAAFGHQFIIDEMTDTYVKVRDPFHGWRIKVAKDAFFKEAKDLQAWVIVPAAPGAREAMMVPPPVHPPLPHAAAGVFAVGADGRHIPVAAAAPVAALRPPPVDPQAREHISLTLNYMQRNARRFLWLPHPKVVKDSPKLPVHEVGMMSSGLNMGKFVGNLMEIWLRAFSSRAESIKSFFPTAVDCNQFLRWLETIQTRSEFDRFTEPETTFDAPLTMNCVDFVFFSLFQSGLITKEQIDRIYRRNFSLAGQGDPAHYFGLPLAEFKPLNESGGPRKGDIVIGFLDGKPQHMLFAADGEKGVGNWNIQAQGVTNQKFTDLALHGPKGDDGKAMEFRYMPLEVALRHLNS